MLSGKYHVGSLVAVFLALGIGILIGGTMGQNWVHQTEAHLAEQMLMKYEEAMESNQNLQKQMISLKMVNQSIAPVLYQKKIWWVKPDDQQYELLAMAASSLGAEWSEKASAEVMSMTAVPDILVFSDSAAFNSWTAQWKELHQSEAKQSIQAEPASMIVIDASKRTKAWNDPKEIVDFILYLKTIVEEDPYASASKAAVDIYHYPGVE